MHQLKLTPNTRMKSGCGDCMPCLLVEFQICLAFYRTILTTLSAKTITLSAPKTYIRGQCVRSCIPHRHRLAPHLRSSTPLWSAQPSVCYCCCAHATGVLFLKMLGGSVSTLVEASECVGRQRRSRWPGSSDELLGDWHPYPSRTQEA
jgi:hypothetical protein